MGEIADAMINGELCEACGVPLDYDTGGTPGYCSKECANDRGADWWEEPDEDDYYEDI